MVHTAYDPTALAAELPLSKRQQTESHQNTAPRRRLSPFNSTLSSSPRSLILLHQYADAHRALAMP